MSRPSGLLALAGLALAFALGACGEDKTTSPASPAKELDSPGLLGATSGSENYIHSFANTGVYPYHCLYHTTAHHRMAGTVVVGDQGPDSAFVSISLGAFNPANVAVRRGGQVRWQNFDDGVHHTVTSD